MAQNLLELVQNYFGGDTVRQASTTLGESESSIGTALRSIVPLVLGGLFARSQQPGGASELFGMATQAHKNGILGDLGSLLGGTGRVNTTAPASDGGLLNKGAELLSSVFGTGYPAAVQGVSQQAGIRESTTSSLMSMAVPVVLGLLGKHSADNNLDANGFSNYLNSQQGSITGALGSLPSGLGSILSGLGLGAAATGINNMASSAATTLGNTASTVANRTGEAARSTAREVEAVATSPSRWPWLLLALVVLGALFYFMRGCNKTPEAAAPVATTAVADSAVVATPPAAPTGRYDEASGNYIYDTGADTTVKLPDGTVLNVGSNSFESRLFNFLNDNSQSVSDDKTQGWMSLDRVYFNTGKSTLTAESQAQLKNVAAILKAFPNAAIKFGGYTDNKGKADMNLTLSADRANAARKAVMNGGIDAGRVAAEGYGQEHPIASNDTPEGRAQNRRVDVRVTKK
jgi:outer membrane protein OmpA-like peptidoglycan-associated protein